MEWWKKGQIIESMKKNKEAKQHKTIGDIKVQENSTKMVAKSIWKILNKLSRYKKKD
jgi:hypothetical protein